MMMTCRVVVAWIFITNSNIYFVFIADPLALCDRYLTISQWDLDGAIRAVGEDGEWEKASVRQNNREGSHLSTSERKAGDIHITLKVHKGAPIAATIRGSGQRSRLSTARAATGHDFA